MECVSRIFTYFIGENPIRIKVSSGNFEPLMKVCEYHILVTVEEPSGKFADQLKAVHQAWETWLQITGKGDKSVLFRRYFLSDIANQEKILREVTGKYEEAISVVQQPPVNGTKVAMWVYMQGKETGLNHKADRPYKHFWFVQEHLTGMNSQEQILRLFGNYQKYLQEKKCQVNANCIRTWLFVRDIDVNYPGVVKGRKEFFYENGLTEATHYIASTGIEGYTGNPQSSVLLDAYAVSGIEPGQFRYLKGLTHLNPTWEYGVTFERGVSIEYGDRRQAYISGTASIDNKGRIVGEGDIVTQVKRMWENVGVLLSEGEYGWEDVAQMIVYIRDSGDGQQVKELFEARFPQTPKILLRASICRPGWLVEMECIAVKKQVQPVFKEFC